MKEESLETQLKGYYAEKNLSDESLARLTSLAEHTLPPPTALPRRISSPRTLAIAATFLLVAAGVFQLGRWVEQVGDVSPDEALVRLIAGEVAHHHNKRLAVEFERNEYEKLSNEMSKLDFALVASERLDGSQLRLLGARYCSIQGQLAAQVKLLDTRDRTFTLFQTRSFRRIAELTDATLEVDGVEVEMWNEGGLFFAIARPRN